jgi:autotransporter passenger strand-loop-strand repeat protein
LNSGDTLNVESGGTSTRTTINSDGTENVYSTSTDTAINSGGVENVKFEGGTSTGTTINSGGVEKVEIFGMSSGTTINRGGIENVEFLGRSTGTTINSGGIENVAAGGTAVNVTFGNQNGETPGGALHLAYPSELTGTISNWHVGDVIDFLNTKVTGVQENAAHTTLTVTYGTNETTSYSLAGQQANTKFQLQSDGHGGTELILTPSTPIVGVASHDPSAGHHPFV